MNGWTWDTQSIVVVASLIAAMGASVVAIAALLSIRQSRKAMWGQLIMQIRMAYASPEMLEGIKDIINWKKKYGSDYAEKLVKLRFEKRTEEVEDAMRVDIGRRRYTHHFRTIKILKDNKIVNEKFVRAMTSPNQINFLIKYVELIEKEISKKYDEPMFRFFEDLYGNELSEVEESFSSESSTPNEN